MSILGFGSGDGPKGYDPGAGKSEVAALPVFTLKYGFTGATEPTWPTTAGATVVDSGGNTWRAIAGRKQLGSVCGIYSQAMFSDDARLEPDSFFQYGVVRWLTGNNAGLKMEVTSHVIDIYPIIALIEAMPYPINIGDTYEISQGCARTKLACKAFDNYRNNAGFPDMPTEEKALTSPNYSQQGQQKEEDDSWF